MSRVFWPRHPDRQARDALPPSLDSPQPRGSAKARTYRPTILPTPLKLRAGCARAEESALRDAAAISDPRSTWRLRQRWLSALHPLDRVQYTNSRVATARSGGMGALPCPSEALPPPPRC